MHAGRGRLLLVAFLAVTAGCGGIVADGGGGGATDAGSLTPAPVPTASADYPPGLSAEGVVDPERLARAHGRTVEGVSYRLRSNRTTRFANGTLRSRIDLDLRLGRNRSHLATVRTAGPGAPVILGQPPARGQYWSNRTLYANRIVREGRTTYSLMRASENPRATWRYWAGTAAFGGGSSYRASRFAAIFEAIPTRVVGTRTVNGTTLYELEGRRAESAAFTAGPADAVGPAGPGPTLRATVDEDGRIRSLHLRYRSYDDGDEYAVDWRIRYGAVGAVGVREPPWLDRAVAASRD